MERINVLRAKRQKYKNPNGGLNSSPNVNNQSHTIDNTVMPKPHSDYDDRGDATFNCDHCGALMWLNEMIEKRRTKIPPKFSLCCTQGKISLPPLHQPPKLICDMLFTKDKMSQNYIDNIRAYNSIFAFTSMGGQIDKTVNTGRGPYVFVLHGVNYHKIGSLLPIDGSNPKFMQLYIHDTEHENANRLNAFNAKKKTSARESNNLQLETVDLIKAMLNECNPYTKILRMAKDRFEQSNECENVKLRLIRTRSSNQNTYNLPTTSEVAALFVGDFDTCMDTRDIVVETKQKELQRISELHPAYLPLQYPLLFPFGEDGYHIDLNLKKTTTTSTKPQTRISMREFFAYKIMERVNEPNILLSSGKLFQQFFVDGLTMIEAERIGYLRLNQKSLRADKYVNISNSAEEGKDYAMNGRRIVLPSTFTGSARYMQEKYMDAKAICRYYGFLDLFITFTCNPKWPEISMYLRDRNLKSEDRPDILARIFKIKLEGLIDDIKNRNIFGHYCAVIYTIEFQKRGLPHAHILLFLEHGSKFPTCDHINEKICAEIPDATKNQELYNIVKQFMIHGPCGLANPRNSCMDKGKCTKRFPKDLCSETHITKDGFPVYRRRDDGAFVEKNGIKLDNRFVIPYNAQLLRHQAHINVEWCNQTKAVKYLFKYINKGQDRVTTSITSNRFDGTKDNHEVIDEIKRYYDCRYISPCEASWRIFGFETHHSSTPVQRLTFHLPGEHNVTYEDGDNVEDILSKSENQTSQFLEWMKTNRENRIAKELSYIEFPSKFVWNKTKRIWSQQKRNISVGRIHHISPTFGELYYLRMLLNKVKGPTSYEDIRNVSGTIYSTYKETCYALGLLDDDKEYIDAIKEASNWGSGYSLRKLFVMLLISESMSRPHHVWLETWELLSEDILYIQQKKNLTGLQMSTDEIQNQTLLEIENMLSSNGSSLNKFPTIPFPDITLLHSHGNKLIIEEISFDRILCKNQHEEMLPKLTDEQRRVYDKIIDSVDKNLGGVYFVYGFGGTGKTFLWKTLTAFVRSKGQIVINVASSGMASLLLDGGRTTHSRFSIPLKVNETSTCSFTRDSELADLIMTAKLIIWDEAPMLHRHCFEAFDRTLKDIAKNRNIKDEGKPFGGKTMVFGGDFRQILPVIPKGTREQVVQSSLSSSVLWNSCYIMRLTKNMRLSSQCDSNEMESVKKFSDWILKLGDGKLSEPNDGEAEIEIPDEFLLKDSLDPITSMCDNIYPSLIENLNNVNFFRERAILCPTNDVVEEVNNHIMNLLRGCETKYYSSDNICCSDSSHARDGEISVEFLNSLKSSGLPNHILSLKKGVPVMLLRNLDQKMVCAMEQDFKLFRWENMFSRLKL